MSHGYFYICDHCDKHKHVEPSPRYRGTYYDRPEKWVSVRIDDKETVFCSKRCAKAYARDCE